jgi:hypothetical protein
LTLYYTAEDDSERAKVFCRAVSDMEEYFQELAEALVTAYRRGDTEGTTVVGEYIREQGLDQVMSGEGRDRLGSTVRKAGKAAVDSVEVTDKRIPPKMRAEMEKLLSEAKVADKWLDHEMARD